MNVPQAPGPVRDTAVPAENRWNPFMDPFWGFAAVCWVGIACGMVWIATEVTGTWPIPAVWLAVGLLFESVRERGVRVDSSGVTLIRWIGRRHVPWEGIGRIHIGRTMAGQGAAGAVVMLGAFAFGGVLGAAVSRWAVRGIGMAVVEGAGSPHPDPVKAIRALDRIPAGVSPVLAVERAGGRIAFVAAGGLRWSFVRLVATEARTRGRVVEIT